MTTRRSTGWLAWLLWALVLVLLAGSLALWLANNAVRPQELPVLRLVVPGFATVGAVIMTRHRGQVIGRLFLGSAPSSPWAASAPTTPSARTSSGGCQPAS